MENNDDNSDDYNQLPDRVLLQTITVVFVGAIYLYLFLKIIVLS